MTESKEPGRNLVSCGRDSGYFENRKVCPFLSTDENKGTLQVLPVQSEHCGWLQENLDEPLLQTVSEDIDTSWWKVGCELGIKFADMDAINDDFNARVHHSKALAVLLRWRQLNGTEATKTRLMHALIAAERKDIADKLAGGGPKVLQLTVEGIYQPQGEIPSNKCCYFCRDTQGERYLAAAIKEESVVIVDTALARAKKLLNRMKEQTDPDPTLPQESRDSFSTQLLICQSIQKRWKNLEVELLDLTVEVADDTSNMETLQILLACGLKLRPQMEELSRQIDLLRSRTANKDSAQQRQLKIVQAYHKGVSDKIGAAEHLMQDAFSTYFPRGYRRSAPASLQEIAEHIICPEQKVRFLSEAVESMRPVVHDTRL